MRTLKSKLIRTDWTSKFPLNLQLFSEEPEKEEKPESKEEPENKEPETKEEPKPEDKKEDSSNKSESAAEKKINHLMDLVELTTEKVEKTYKAALEAKEEMQEAAAELKETTALLQGMIGDMDAQTQQLISAAAALIKLHKAQSAKAGA